MVTTEEIKIELCERVRTSMEDMIGILSKDTHPLSAIQQPYNSLQIALGNLIEFKKVTEFIQNKDALDAEFVTVEDEAPAN